MTLKATIKITRTTRGYAAPYGQQPKDHVETIVDVADLEAAPRALAALLEGLSDVIDPAPADFRKPAPADFREVEP